MLTKAEKRKREERKNTAFELGDRPLTVERIERSAKRGKTQNLEELESKSLLCSRWMKTKF